VTCTQSSVHFENTGDEQLAATTRMMVLPRHFSSATTPVIHILGAGSIGMLLAASLRLAHYHPRLLVREQDYTVLPYSASLSSSTSSSSSPSNNQNKSVRTICLLQQYPGAPPHLSRPRWVDVACQTTTTTAKQQQQQQRPRMIDTLLVTTKAYDAVAAIESIRHLLHENATVVILSNGTLAIQDELLLLRQDRHRQKMKVVLGTITHGVYRTKTGINNTDDGGVISVSNTDDPENQFHSIVHAGMGTIRLEAGLDGLAEMLDQAGLRCAVDSHIRVLLWKKLAANCVINPLTALNGCPNGELLDRIDGFTTDIMPDLVREVYDVYCHSEKGKDPSSEAAVEKEEEGDDGDEFQAWQDYVLEVIQATAANRSSMLQDVQQQQPTLPDHPLHRLPRRTEIDALNGFVVRRAQSLGLPCDKNERLVQDVHKLTHGFMYS
jgi:2-dehydropantoate 2-reductase